jgi:Family of unknown function (DUF6545)
VRYSTRSRRNAELRCTEMVRRLAVPVPFELEEFRACLERRIRRVVELVPVEMEPGAPSGTWFRTAGADYLCYEQQTSAFHQAHIVLSLAAHLLLLGDAAGPSVDLRLVPDVSPELVRLMLGGAACSPVTQLEAETFAFLALDRTLPDGYPSSLARAAFRYLRPLHSALRRAVPEVTSAGIRGVRPGVRFRLHQRVIEISDAVLALRPYRDPQVASAAAGAGGAAGLAGDDLAAAVEAAVLAAAMRARCTGDPPLYAVGNTGDRPLVEPDLRSEAVWLVMVSRAFAESPLADSSARDEAPEICVDGIEPDAQENLPHAR